MQNGGHFISASMRSLLSREGNYVSSVYDNLIKLPVFSSTLSYLQPIIGETKPDHVNSQSLNCKPHIDGLEQDCNNSSAIEIKLLQSSIDMFYAGKFRMYGWKQS